MTRFYGSNSAANFLWAGCSEPVCLKRPAVCPGQTFSRRPQHPAHLRRRGFNQAHELARAVRRLTDLPLRSDLLFRTLQGAPQAGLSAAERHRNVRRSFRASRMAEGLRIWLIDDVMTTGSTLAAAVSVLREAGAREVPRVFTAARRTTFEQDPGRAAPFQRPPCPAVQS